MIRFNSAQWRGKYLIEQKLRQRLADITDREGPRGWSTCGDEGGWLGDSGGTHAAADSTVVKMTATVFLFSRGPRHTQRLLTTTVR